MLEYMYHKCLEILFMLQTYICKTQTLFTKCYKHVSQMLRHVYLSNIHPYYLRNTDTLLAAPYNTTTFITYRRENGTTFSNYQFYMT